MGYAVKEIYYTLQGEGAQTGRPAVFLRFTGCNLWSGREEDRASAVCNFCDTDFVGTDGPGGGKFSSAKELAAAVAAEWKVGGQVCPRKMDRSPLVVCTGGEPLLQLDAKLVDALHDAGFSVAVETNGTLPPPPGIDWLCVSPKAGTHLVVTSGDELKLVYPQPGLDPAEFTSLDFHYFFLQPMDGPRQRENQQLAAEYCLAHPHWRLGLQMHKVLGIR
jgi:7-carboxy-7-deazaguanine synthase (Cx14CxxC type)